MLSLKHIGSIVDTFPATNYRDVYREVPVRREHLSWSRTICVHELTWLFPGLRIVISLETTADPTPDGNKELFYFDRRTLSVAVNGCRVPLIRPPSGKSQMPFWLYDKPLRAVDGLGNALRVS